LTEIIPASPSDARRIAGMAREIWTEVYVDLIGAEQTEYMLRMFQDEGPVARQMASEGHLYFVIREDGEDAGYMDIVPQEGLLYLSKMYVRKPFRRRGLAAAALERADEEGLSRGLSSIYVRANRMNSRAIAAYERLGFRTWYYDRSDIGGGFFMDDRVMIRDLRRDAHPNDKNRQGDGSDMRRLFGRRREDRRTAEEQYASGLDGYSAGGKGLNTALEDLSAAAGGGHTGAMFLLGCMYEDGDGVLRDERRAAEYYAGAAEAGHAGASLNLGIMHLNGLLPDEDLSEAFRLISKAAESGDPEAEAALGTMYYEGLGTETDLSKAYSLYRASFDAGYRPAVHELALMTYRGEGTGKDEEEARRMLREAAHRGDEDAEATLRALE